MKLSEGLRCWCFVIVLVVGLKCISAAPQSQKVSSGEQVLVITTDSSLNDDFSATTNVPSSGESWEVDNKNNVLDMKNLEEVDSSDYKLIKPEIYSFRIQSDIKYRYARTYVTSRVANRDLKKSQEVSFRVVLPETAFISKFVMEIDGKQYEAYVTEKEEAKRVYTEAQNQGQSAGLVEVSTRNSNIFNVNVNIKPQSKVNFNLTYEELLSRRLGRYEQSINISPEQITSVKDFQIIVNIEESQNITSLKVPNLRNDIEAQEDAGGNNKDAIIVRPSGNKANITWSPSAKDQETLSKQGITGKFVIQYDINRESNSGEVLLMEGYFVHFFAPEKLQPLRKHVVFILDISGSMWGRKMEQLKDSQKRILDDLSPDDFFNIITFSSDVFLWSPNDPLPAEPHTARWHSHLRYMESQTALPNNEMKEQPFPATEQNINKAKQFIDSIVANGGTNIHDSIITALNLTKKIKDLRDGIQNNPKNMVYEALPTALPMEDATTLQPKMDSTVNPSEIEYISSDKTILPQNVESLIIFLTDGEPTVGVTDPAYIQKLIQAANTNLTIPLFSLGFGEGADFPFLRKLSLQNYGFARKIYEASDAALQLKGFYNEIASPLLSNVVFNYTSPEYNITDVTITEFPTVFGGTEIAVAGRLVPLAPPAPNQNEFASDSQETTVGTGEMNAADSTDAPEIETTTLIVDSPLRDSDNDLVIADKNYLSVSISGSGREGIVDFDSPKMFCGVVPWGIPGLRPFPPLPTPPPSQEDQFLERLWAYLTIKQLIDRDLKEDVSSNEISSNDLDFSIEEMNPTSTVQTKTSSSSVLIINTTLTKETPKQQAIRLALKYGFVTPFTSLVVVKPNSSDVTDTVSSDAKPQFADSFAAPQSMAHYAVTKFSGISNRIAGPQFLAQSLPLVPQSLSLNHPGMHNKMGIYPSRPFALSGIRQRTTQASLIQMSIDYDVGSLEESQALLPSSIEIEETTTTPTATTSRNPSLTLQNVRWFSKKNLELRINGTEYKIMMNDTEVKVEETSCHIKTNGTSVSGECRHLKDCIQVEFTEDFGIFTDSYFCALKSSSIKENFVGACCPSKARNFSEDP